MKMNALPMSGDGQAEVEMPMKRKDAVKDNEPTTNGIIEKP